MVHSKVFQDVDSTSAKPVGIAGGPTHRQRSRDSSSEKPGYKSILIFCSCYWLQNSLRQWWMKS